MDKAAVVQKVLELVVAYDHIIVQQMAEYDLPHDFPDLDFSMEIDEEGWFVRPVVKAKPANPR